MRIYERWIMNTYDVRTSWKLKVDLTALLIRQLFVRGVTY